MWYYVPVDDGWDFFDPLKMSLKMAHKVIVPQKKILSRSFLNSGTLIVKMPFVLNTTIALNLVQHFKVDGNEK